MVYHVKFFTTSSLITVLYLVVVSHTVCAHVGGGPKNLEKLGPYLPEMGAGLTPRNTLLPTYGCHIKFLRSRSNRSGVGMASQKFWVHWAPPLWDGAVARPLYFSVPVLPCHVPSFQVKPYKRNYGDLPENFDHSRPAFQGQSKSLEPARINRLPMVSHDNSTKIEARFKR